MARVATRSRRGSRMLAGLLTGLAVTATLLATAGTANGAGFEGMFQIRLTGGDCLTETGFTPGAFGGTVEVQPCGGAESTWVMSTLPDRPSSSVRLVNRGSGRALAFNIRGGPEIITSQQDPNVSDVWGIERERVDNGQNTFINSIDSGVFMTAGRPTPNTKLTDVGSAPKDWVLVRVDQTN